MASGGKASIWTTRPGLLTRIAAVVIAGACASFACGRGSSQAPPPGTSIAPGPHEASPEAPARVSSNPCANGSLAEVRRIVGEMLGREGVNPGQTLADLRADDLDLVEIVMAIEDQCSLEIPDSDIEAGLKMTVDQIARLVDRKVQAKAAGSGATRR